MEHLASELGRPELGRLFAVAERLHANFYHNFYHNFIRDPKSFRPYRADVLRLVDVLTRVVESALGQQDS